MKITDRINLIGGVEYSHWDAPNERLVVYYGDSALQDTIGIRVVACIASIQLQGSVKTITLISGA